MASERNSVTSNQNLGFDNDGVAVENSINVKTGRVNVEAGVTVDEESTTTSDSVGVNNGVVGGEVSVSHERLRCSYYMTKRRSLCFLLVSILVGLLSAIFLKLYSMELVDIMISFIGLNNFLVITMALMLLAFFTAFAFSFIPMMLSCGGTLLFIYYSDRDNCRYILDNPVRFFIWKETLEKMQEIVDTECNKGAKHGR